MFLSCFLQLLPALIHGVSGLAASGSDKKAMVETAMAATAEGVAAFSPEHGVMASEAAAVATHALEGVYAIMKTTGKLQTAK